MTPVEDASVWDGLVAGSARGHLLQGAAWGEVKSRWGWEVERFRWPEAGALAQALVRRLGPVGPRMGYLPKGPLLSHPDAAADWRRVLGDVAAWARRRRLLYVKMDGDQPAGPAGPAEVWRALGWLASPEQIQFPNTMLSPLGDEGAMLARMTAKARYNLRLAERRGVRAAPLGEGGVDRFLAMYRQTGGRAGFGVRSDAYYRDVIATLSAGGRAALVLAEREGVDLAAVFIARHGDRAWYLYGASADAGREHMASYMAQWAAMTWAAGQGCVAYDWWGGPTRLAEDDPLWGVYRFKLGFGAQLVEQAGAWDLPVWPIAYRAYQRLARWRAARIARRSGRGGVLP